ncbi:hypothetical protein [Corallococcus sp. RDP092CA]|uniref:hypothetical protein n=1 Tax=Corallococcus sp. RDP092CA TaxID=3109369 RepID=UPI0035AFD696
MEQVDDPNVKRGQELFLSAQGSWLVHQVSADMHKAMRMTREQFEWLALFHCDVSPGLRAQAVAVVDVLARSGGNRLR